MASNQQHPGRRRLGHCYWTRADLRILEQYGPHQDWTELANEHFTVNGVLRHTSLECHKMWCKKFRDPNEKEPTPIIKCEAK